MLIFDSSCLTKELLRRASLPLAHLAATPAWRECTLHKETPPDGPLGDWSVVIQDTRTIRQCGFVVEAAGLA